MIRKLYIKNIDVKAIGNITPDFVAEEFKKETAYRRETLEFHMSYDEETHMLLLIKNGDYNGLLQFFNKISGNGFMVGSMSESNIKQSKYLFVCGVTMFTRAGIEGGLDVEMAYDLSDAYIKSIDKIDESNQILELLFISAIDFAKRVSSTKMSRSLPIKKCCEYIHNHLHNKITLKDLSNVSGHTESYLSITFKDQMGINPSEYIINEKLEAAKELLQQTDMPVAAIAEQFGFCTPSNFSQHFRKLYGITPSEFRNSNNGVLWNNI